MFLSINGHKQLNYFVSVQYSSGNNVLVNILLEKWFNLRAQYFFEVGLLPFKTLPRKLVIIYITE